MDGSDEFNCNDFPMTITTTKTSTTTITATTNVAKSKKGKKNVAQVFNM